MVGTIRRESFKKRRRARRRRSCARRCSRRSVLFIIRHHPHKIVLIKGRDPNLRNAVVVRAFYIGRKPFRAFPFGIIFPQPNSVPIHQLPPCDDVRAFCARTVNCEAYNCFSIGMATKFARLACCAFFIFRWALYEFNAAALKPAPIVAVPLG